MVQIGAREAEDRLMELLDRVVAGEQITITRSGAPVAVLSPVEVRSNSPTRRVIAELRAFRRGRTLNGSLQDMMEEGRS
jgi:prevent-host-death family protein